MVLGGAFMMENIPHTIGNWRLPLKCGFGIGYGSDRKYRPIWVSVLVSDLNQNSGFGCTLHCNPLQGSTGKYRENPVMKTGTLQ